MACNKHKNMNFRKKSLSLLSDMPPPNPAKTDTRCGSYISRFGHESWELDALEPQVIETLIRDKVQALTK